MKINNQINKIRKYGFKEWSKRTFKRKHGIVEVSRGKQRANSKYKAKNQQVIRRTRTIENSKRKN